MNPSSSSSSSSNSSHEGKKFSSGASQPSADEDYISIAVSRTANELSKPFAEQNRLPLRVYMSDILVWVAYKMDFVSQWQPHMSIMGVQEEHLVLFDKKRNESVDISFVESKVYCRLDKSHDCEHINFALATPQLGLIWANYKKKQQQQQLKKEREERKASG